MDPLAILEDLATLGFTLGHDGGTRICLLQEPAFSLDIRKGSLVFFYKKRKLTKRVWIDRLIERVWEKKALVTARALAGG